jgi:Ni/Co efflux regulator RcnB
MRHLILGLLAATMVAGPVLADPRWDRRDERREWRDDRRDWRDDRREWRDDRRDWYRDQKRWQKIARDDWRWAGPRHRGPVYVYPRGMAYRPWGVGYRLPPAYFARPYWVNDFGMYRLPPPWRGARWVRVGPDALMIRVGDGFVLQAVRGLWW